MALPGLIVLFVVIVALYYLVVKGLLFKLILLVAGCICIGVVLSGMPEMRVVAFTIGNTTVSYAAALPLGLALLVLLTSKE
jgi:hypothetical protein